MEKKVKRTEGAYSKKVKQAAHLLFFKHHRLPGVRGWELKQELGSDWLEVVEILDNQLKNVDLQVSHVFDEPDINLEPSREQLLDARFYITMRGDVDQKTVKTIGWRIDDIAGLAVAVAYIISKQGKASRSEVERVLMEKLPGWRVKANLDNYIDEGYLGQTENGLLYLDWRSRAEIDEKKLVDLILSFGKQTA
ncbi:hypothetical protein KEJ21_00925 [Candidatus Bathyarchaeota archaeon]|nr:hypothetical protein [Candidatus Bathyarchaeota archaeon]